MVEARRREQWNHTASLMAWIGNSNPYKKKGKTFAPGDFHPCLAMREEQPLRAEFSVLKAVFVKGGE
jgi:hypothetical protein